MRTGLGSRLKLLTRPSTSAPMAPAIMTIMPIPEVAGLVARFQVRAPTATMTPNIAAVRMMTSS